jgi:hypothetical protein
MRRLLALVVLCLLVAAVPAVAARRLHVSGPSVVRVGEVVTFPTSGFKPHERLTVNLAPTANRGGNCCGIDVITRARADADGKAVLHWRWPDHYLNGGDRRPWRAGSKADVLVLTPSYARGLRVVRVGG